jgi:hypothetical protein
VSTVGNFDALPIDVYRRLVAVTPERGARRGNLRARGRRERRDGDQREQCEGGDQLLHDRSPGYGRSSAVSCKQREADGQRFAVMSSRAEALIDTGEMGRPAAKEGAKSHVTPSRASEGQTYDVCVFAHSYLRGALTSDS